ncbi:MAG: LPXTG cell wall anchor domain-containing protein [Clostridia bacterium]|nr:LPXTG cell wall anchor domain-containing protein [Clostridia bacterium]
MKKLLFFITTVIILSLSFTAFAATSNISIKNNEVNSTPVTYSYDAASSGEIVKSIKSLMTKIDELSKQDSVVQTLTISSLSADKKAVAFKLRLSLPDKNNGSEKPEKLATPSPEEYAALDYYKIKVTTSNGDVLYDADEEKSEDTTEQKSYKDIPLGTLNSTDSAENRIYNLTISVDKSLNKNTAVANASRKLDWSIVSEIAETSENKADVEEGQSNDGDSANNDNKMTPAPSANTVQQNTPKPAGSVAGTLKKGEYAVGTDIPADRYKMTGKGKVSVYTPDGIVKMSVVLKQKGDASTNGVEEYVLSLSDGERLVVENEATLTPHKAQALIPSPTPTAKPSAASSANSSKTNTSSTSKNNPKTGDTTPVILIVVIGVAALAGIGFIEYKKRQIK